MVLRDRRMDQQINFELDNKGKENTQTLLFMLNFPNFGTLFTPHSSEIVFLPTFVCCD